MFLVGPQNVSPILLNPSYAHESIIPTITSINNNQLSIITCSRDYTKSKLDFNCHAIAIRLIKVCCVAECEVFHKKSSVITWVEIQSQSTWEQFIAGSQINWKCENVRTWVCSDYPEICKRDLFGEEKLQVIEWLIQSFTVFALHLIVTTPYTQQR